MKNIIFTDIDKDGMLAGPNFDQLAALRASVSCEIIASGGVSTLEDIAALKKLGIDGAIAGKAVYTGTLDLAKAIKGGGVMLAKRIIPCLDVKDGRVVKGVNFVGLRDAGDPVELAKFYSQEGADEIVFLDITATSDNRDTIADVVRRTCREVFVPVTVGGGIRTVDDFREILRAGADKISINSSAVKNPDLVNAAAEKYGSQCVVVAIDARANEQMPSGFEVYVAGGRTPTGKDAVAWAKEVYERGAGEILLTSMDKDGTKSGFDLPLYQGGHGCCRHPGHRLGRLRQPRAFFRGVRADRL